MVFAGIGPMNTWPHKVDLLTGYVESFDESGDLADQYADSIPLPAFVDTSPGGREYQIAATGVPSQTYTISVYTPYREDITADSIILWEGRRYHLNGPPADQGGQKRVMVLTAVEVKRNA